MRCYIMRWENKVPFDIAILDMQMPGLDGFTLGKVIKSDEKIKSVPLVMMTSIGHRGEVQKLKTIGFSAYLTKPVSPEDLYNTLSVILGNSESIAQDPQNVEIITKFNLIDREKANIKVLVVEDNPINQKVAIGMLKTLGIDASYVAENGKDALDQLMKYEFDLIFMDMQMPVLDGVETTRKIRNSTSGVINTKIPIIAMTANAMKGAEEVCKKAGMDDYIAKPIKLEQLSEMVGKWLQKIQKEPIKSEPVKKTVQVEGVIFDKAVMMENLGNNMDLINDIMAIFLENTASNLKKMDALLAKDEFEEAAKVAHAIKGSSGNVTSEILYNIALKLENACKAADMKLVDEQLILLKQNFQWFIDKKGKY